MARATIVVVLAGAALAPTPGALRAQAPGTLLGRVVAANSGVPLEGVLVHVPAAGVGVLTGVEGWYILSGIPLGQQKLEVALVGYSPQVHHLELRSPEPVTMHFALDPEAIPLAGVEVVVEREGATKRLAGADVSVVEGEALRDGTATSFDELLRGRVAGVSQTPVSGQAGAATQIRIRGVRSLFSGQPLVFVDGVRVGSAHIRGPAGTFQVLEFLENIDPADVAKIEVLRGPSATTLYGREARDGVILIYTKQGKRTPPQGLGLPKDR